MYAIQDFLWLPNCSGIQEEEEENDQDDLLICTKEESRDLKKLRHNTNERQRRKKLNALFAKLGSLLPHANRTKKLSVPAVVCGVLEYIPWLQKRIEILARKRDELLAIRQISQAPRDGLPNLNFEQHLDQNHGMFFDVKVNISAVAKTEVVITVESPPFLFSNVLVLFGQENLDVLNASTFVSENIVWHTIQLKVMKSSSLQLGALRSKILVVCQKCLQDHALQALRKESSRN